MGRPPLNLIRVHVYFSAHALNRIEKRVPQNGRPALIRKAVDKYLDDLDAAEASLSLKGKKGE